VGAFVEGAGEGAGYAGGEGESAAVRGGRIFEGCE
jgi:hypothetical protein